MRINIRALAALIVAVIVIVVAFDATRHQALSGSELSFSINTGHVALVNDTGEPLMATISSGRGFQIVSDDESVTLESTRQGTGRQATHIYEGELPPGNLQLRLARGSDVNFQLRANNNITANVAPRNDGDTITILALAAIVILGALYYFSRSTGHAWLRFLRRSLSRSTPEEAAN